MARTANFKCLMEPALKRRLDDLIERRNTKLTPAMDSLVRWLLDQDTLVQSMLLGGIDPKDYAEVAQLVLKRLAEGRRFDAVLDERGALPGGAKTKPDRGTKGRAS